jgi:hypothetical protein
VPEPEKIRKKKTKEEKERRTRKGKVIETERQTRNAARTPHTGRKQVG